MKNKKILSFLLIAALLIVSAGSVFATGSVERDELTDMDINIEEYLISQFGEAFWTNHNRALENIEIIWSLFPDDRYGMTILPDFMGGLYLNNDGNLVVQIVDNDTARAQAIAALSNAVNMDEIIIKYVEFPESYLLEIINSLNSLWSDNPDCDVVNNVTSFGLDTMNNRVEFGLRVYNEAEIARFRDTILDSPAITFAQGYDLVLLGDAEEDAVVLTSEIVVNEVTLPSEFAPVWQITATGSILILPLRAIAEALGYEVSWNGYERYVEVFLPNERMYRLTIGWDFAFCLRDYSDYSLPIAPFIMDNTTFVPAEFFSAVLGLNIDARGRNVYIFEEQTYER
ncbi:MAG: copper amine oxidase N-terminal domain-containing protein [Oscillospiraceae bacterium]|nr:copper amine oxidase N-terminal domain-containing protein [Oscillospiraceae bacterium]